jgi:hypothetical protein
MSNKQSRKARAAASRPSIGGLAGLLLLVGIISTPAAAQNSRRTPNQAMTPAAVSPSERAQRGEKLFNTIAAKYKMIVEFGWQAKNVSLPVPTDDWDKLRKEDQANLTYYAESLVPAVRQSPRKYVDRWRQRVQNLELPYEEYVAAASRLCDTCWQVEVGKPVKDIDGIWDVEGKAAVSGETVASFRRAAGLADAAPTSSPSPNDKPVSDAIQDANTLVLLVIGLIFFGIPIFLILRAKRKYTNKVYEEVEAVDKMPVGKYIAGLPSYDQSGAAVECAMSERDFVFIARDYMTHKGIEIGRIPRDAVNQIFFEDKSQITQRLTATRILAMGVFSLAAPKKQKLKEFCVVFDWDDNAGVRQNTVFEFSGGGADTSANQAVNKLKRYLKPKVERLRAGEKKCPQCAEVIKAEAKVCRFCGASF